MYMCFIMADLGMSTGSALTTGSALVEVDDFIAEAGRFNAAWTASLPGGHLDSDLTFNAALPASLPGWQVSLSLAFFLPFFVDMMLEPFEGAPVGAGVSSAWASLAAASFSFASCFCFPLVCPLQIWMHVQNCRCRRTQTQHRRQSRAYIPI